MITNQMSPAEHISHAIRSLIEAAELTEGMLSDSGREHFASILFRVGEHVEQARAKVAADKLPRARQLGVGHQPSFELDYVKPQ